MSERDGTQDKGRSAQVLSGKANAPASPSATIQSVAPARLGAALLLLSTATVLFTLAVFKLLSFFIMPSLFFDLLFIGFPIGGFLGARFFGSSERSFRGTLWILQGVMVASLAATLACKHFDYLRAHLFEVRLEPLIVQMGTFTALFLPFFCAYGLSEYVGYQVGRRHLEGRMAIVYGLYLFGAALGYVFIEAMLSKLGVSRVLLLPLLLVAVASLLLRSTGAARIASFGVVIATALAIAVPHAAEGAFLDLYKGTGEQSTHAYEKLGYENVFQRWGRYSLTEILRSPDGNERVGFYNDLMQWEYSNRAGFTERGIGMLPLYLVPPGSSIAVIGAGGGRQVRWALQPHFDFRSILALEVEPAVFEAIEGPLAEDFGGVYSDRRVRAVLHEARSYMEATDERFDLIYLPSVGGYPQMMLEPGNMIRTLDAYATLRQRLSDRGVLAIWYPIGLDPKGILTEQYVRTLEHEEIGMSVRAYWNHREFLILATRPANAAALDLEPHLGILEKREGDGISLEGNPGARPRNFVVPPDAEFKPIHDDQPFLAGNVRHIFSLDQVKALFGRIAGFLAIAGVVLLVALRRRGDPRIPARSYWQVAGLSFLIGANFLVIERGLILALFRELYMFHDALVLGAISFLILSGLGSVLVTDRTRPVLQLVGVGCLVALVVLRPWLAPGSTIALVAPVAFVTGSFFPALFERAAKNPLGVFAMDAVGAAAGSILAFFVPIALGIDWYFPFATLLFAATAVATWLFFRSLRLEAPPS